MPLVKGDTSGNIRELIRAGHPQKQAVAIALRLEGRRGKKKVKLAKAPQNFEDPGYSTTDLTQGIANPDEYLENLGPSNHWLHHALRVLQQKRKSGELHRQPTVRDNSRTMPKKFVLSPQTDYPNAGHWFMGSWGNEEHPHFHVGYAHQEGTTMRRNPGSHPIPMTHEDSQTFLDPAIEHAKQHGHKQTQKMLEGLKKEAKKRWGDRQPTITGTEESLWPNAHDPDTRLVLADVLEEAGDPLYHFLRAAEPAKAHEDIHTHTRPNFVHYPVLPDAPVHEFYHPHISHVRNDMMNWKNRLMIRTKGEHPTTLAAYLPEDVSNQIIDRLRGKFQLSRPNVIALRLEGRRGKKVKLSRDQGDLWPHVNDPFHRAVLADILEEQGDPLHHVLRQETNEKEGIGDHKFLWVPHSHPSLNSLAINYYPGKNWHSVFLHSTPHEQQLPAIRGRVTTEQLKDILHQHWDRTKGKEGYDRSALYRSGIYSHKELKERGYLGLSRPNVIAEANSQAQDIRKFIATKIAKEARLKLINLLDARSQDNAGLVQSYEAPGDEAGVDYAAAWYGMLTNQPSVTTFHENPQGPDTFYKWRVAGDADEALKTLPPGTFVDKDGWAHYLDKGSQHPMDGISGARGTAMTMQGRGAYRDFIKKYQGE